MEQKKLPAPLNVHIAPAQRLAGMSFIHAFLNTNPVVLRKDYLTPRTQMKTWNLLVVALLLMRGDAFSVPLLPSTEES